MMDKFIGIPFVDKGRDLKGCDCFGLVELYYKHILDIEINYMSIPCENSRRIFADFLHHVSKDWVRVEEPEKHCVVALCTNDNHPDMVTHFGIMLDKKRMLHTLKKTESHVVQLENNFFKIKGFYKWRY